jgi:multiple antibiotic resistance protein
MSHALSAFFFVVAALFPIVNPIGMAPIFLSMTAGASPAARRLLAQRIALGGLALLAVSLFVGTYVLAFFGLTLPAVQIGGGLLVSATGWRLLQRSDDPRDRGNPTLASDSVMLRRAFFPLTMPLTVGPGSIAVAITLGSSAPRSGGLASQALGAFAGLLAIAGSIYLCFRYADRLLRIVGDAGTDVIIRLSAFILLCLGIQILWRGLSTLLAATPLAA